jgi:hypothetical protein
MAFQVNHKNTHVYPSYAQALCGIIPFQGNSSWGHLCHAQKVDDNDQVNSK